jgi:hypothetical protein
LFPQRGGKISNTYKREYYIFYSTLPCVVMICLHNITDKLYTGSKVQKQPHGKNYHNALAYKRQVSNQGLKV